MMLLQVATKELHDDEEASISSYNLMSTTTIMITMIAYTNHFNMDDATTGEPKAFDYIKSYFESGCKKKNQRLELFKYSSSFL